MARLKRKRRVPASKKYVVWSCALAGTVTVYAMAISPIFGDIPMLSYLIPAVYGNLATSLGFYFKKSERENTKGGIIYGTAMRADNDQELG